VTTKYSGFTNLKSVNAQIAENGGRFSATEMAKVLRSKKLFKGVTAKAIKNAVATLVWHHVGTYDVAVKYYGIKEVYKARRELRSEIVRLRKEKNNEVIKVYENCGVRWLEWSCTQSHPLAEERESEGARITVKGVTATIELEGGETFKKRLSTKGFDFWPVKKSGLY
jgi:hypothetical protein